MNKTKPATVLAAATVLLLAFAGIGLAGRLHANAEKPSAVATPTTPAAAPPIPLKVVTVGAAPKEAHITLPGTLNAWQATAIHPRADGYLKRYLADLGDSVQTGQLLAEIETPELEQDVISARAKLAQAKAQLKLATSTDARYRELVAVGAVSKLEAENRATANAAAEADVNLAQAQLTRLLSQNGYRQVRAPFAGRITRRLAEPGMLVAASTTLFELADTTQLRVLVQVPQGAATAIAKGQKAEILLREAPGQVFAGTVTRTAGALDAARTLTTEISLDNRDGKLLPGSAVDVRLTAGNSAGAVLIPGNALIVNGKGSYVAVIDGGIAHLTPVQLGRDLGKQIEVLDGLALGATVAVNPPDTLVEGAKVEAEAVAPAEKPKA